MAGDCQKSAEKMIDFAIKSDSRLYPVLPLRETHLMQLRILESKMGFDDRAKFKLWLFSLSHSGFRFDIGSKIPSRSENALKVLEIVIKNNSNPQTLLARLLGEHHKLNLNERRALNLMLTKKWWFTQKVDQLYAFKKQAHQLRPSSIIHRIISYNKVLNGTDRLVSLMQDFNSLGMFKNIFKKHGTLKNITELVLNSNSSTQLLVKVADYGKYLRGLQTNSLLVKFKIRQEQIAADNIISLLHYTAKNPSLSFEKVLKNVDLKKEHLLRKVFKVGYDIETFGLTLVKVYILLEILDRTIYYVMMEDADETVVTLSPTKEQTILSVDNDDPRSSLDILLDDLNRSLSNGDIRYEDYLRMRSELD